MTVKLFLRHPEPASGQPPEISSTFETQDVALDQAVHDIHQERAYSPQRIEAEDGSVLVDRAELEKAAAKAS